MKSVTATRAVSLMLLVVTSLSFTTAGAEAEGVSKGGQDAPPPEEEPVCTPDGSGSDDVQCADPSSSADDDGDGDGDASTVSPEEEELMRRNGYLPPTNTNQQQQQQSKDEPEPDYFMCKDIDDKCPAYATERPAACSAYSSYMTYYCPASCGKCDLSYLGWRLSRILEDLTGRTHITPHCQDDDYRCSAYVAHGECDKNPNYMNMVCKASCGICSEPSNLFGVGQRLHKQDTLSALLVWDRLVETMEYMNTVRRDRKYRKVRKDCLNYAHECTLWAAQGECENNPAYMKANCAPACMSCDYLGDTSETCVGLPESAGPLWKQPGDLNAFFEEIVDGGGTDSEGGGEYYRQFNPRALSRPKKRGGDDGSPAAPEEKDGPWVILLENFLTDAEADGLVEIGHAQGYDRSTRTIGAGKVQATDARTSANTWCREPSCTMDPRVRPVLERIARVTGSTTNHSEHLQLLRYEEGQFYRRHHDFIPYQLDYPCGARIMTLFLYLNDVEEGGNTGFPELGISVKPKKGSAVLWPSVLDEDPMERDDRTDHEAEPVIKGVKYAANAWIHSEDFQSPFALECLQ